MPNRRTEELEQFFARFPEIPREVIVKEDLLRLGFAFTQAAVDASEGSPKIRGTLFTALKVKHEELPKGEAVKVPEEVHISGGPYGLKRTIVYNRLNPNSPYVVDAIEGQLVLTADGTRIANAAYPPMPRYFSKKFDDGTLYSEVLPVRGNNGLAFNNCYRVCQFWGEKEECKFCDINWNARERAKQGIGWTRAKPYKAVDQVAEVAAEVFLNEGYLPGPRPFGILMTGGAILSKVAGKDEDEFYLEYVRAIRDRIGNRMPLVLQIGAKDREGCKRYRDAGVTAHSAHIEVWDKDLFKWICPGKQDYIGWDEWVKRVVESVDVFGEGNVTPNFVNGVQMAQPHGFKDVDSALKSMEEGLDFLMSQGVTPRYESWHVSPYSALADNPHPPLEYYVRSDLIWCEIWNKYDLPQVACTGPMGPGRARYQVTGIHDMDPCRLVPA